MKSRLSFLTGSFKNFGIIPKEPLHFEDIIEYFLKPPPFIHYYNFIALAEMISIGNTGRLI